MASKAAGQPCLCQSVPGSGILCIVAGVALLCATRVPTYLNRERHQLQCTHGGPKVPCWCLTLRWMRRYDDMIDKHIFEAGGMCGEEERPVDADKVTDGHQI